MLAAARTSTTDATRPVLACRRLKPLSRRRRDEYRTFHKRQAGRAGSSDSEMTRDRHQQLYPPPAFCTSSLQISPRCSLPRRRRRHVSHSFDNARVCGLADFFAHHARARPLDGSQLGLVHARGKVQGAGTCAEYQQVVCAECHHDGACAARACSWLPAATPQNQRSFPLASLRS